MALSPTAATLYISGKKIQAPTPKNTSIFSNSISFTTKQRRRLSIIRNSGDVSSETPATEAESEKSIDEAPKGPPSLISALNVERALRGIGHHGSILSSVEERRLYDWSLARTEQPDRYAWPFEVDITQTPTEEPPPEEPEDVGPTRLVGYFMLGWLILSFVLSIALAR